MSRKERLAEIQNIKAVLDDARGLFTMGGALDRLAEGAEKAEAEGKPLDIFPVRAVSRAEVRCRQLLRETVAHSAVYAKRAIPLLTNIKIDYSLLISVSDDEVTFSDIVAHTISFSNLSDTFRVFEQLFETRLSEDLPKVRDGYGYAPQQGQKALVEDYERACSEIDEIYVVRHRICHEGLSSDAKELKGIGLKLRSFSRFFAALNDFVIRRLNPDLPRTQLEINEQAGKALWQARTEMEVQIAAFKERYAMWPNLIKRLELSQDAWERFVEAQQNLRHDPDGGGTIGPFLWALEAEELTRERTAHLKWFAQRGEGDM
jgi:uncharacterized protein YecT (DUF1311 family)